MRWKNLLFLWAMLLLLSSCCKRKTCTGVENVFSAKELRYISVDSLAYNTRVRRAFVSNHGQVDSIYINVTNYKQNVRCEWACCKICEEDREAIGNLNYAAVVDNQHTLHNFDVDITRSKKGGFQKQFLGNSISFNEFDSLKINFTIHTKTYDSVYIKTFDTLQGELYKVWYTPGHGLLKYHLTQNSIWELQ
ncbi:MAG TPA: hypothetical protein VNB90_08260 [Cytophagaceae bacterium]|nr:hypothetical protein [Cytophagaceae bacterium]